MAKYNHFSRERVSSHQLVVGRNGIGIGIGIGIGAGNGGRTIEIGIVVAVAELGPGELGWGFGGCLCCGGIGIGMVINEGGVIKNQYTIQIVNCNGNGHVNVRKHQEVLHCS